MSNSTKTFMDTFLGQINKEHIPCRAGDRIKLSSKISLIYKYIKWI